jgi:alkanesulfonate monooxygenase SsuD/methylene tetrahydromethanopterin reductase-like flavin-dependent oxidoreductase (luciferase family)
MLRSPVEDGMCRWSSCLVAEQHRVDRRTAGEIEAGEAVFECWTTIAAISQRTTKIRLGQMVGCNAYRQPSVLAKITSNIDVGMRD